MSSAPGGLKHLRCLSSSVPDYIGVAANRPMSTRQRTYNRAEIPCRQLDVVHGNLNAARASGRRRCSLPVSILHARGPRSTLDDHCRRWLSWASTAARASDAPEMTEENASRSKPHRRRPRCSANFSHQFVSLQLD